MKLMNALSIGGLNKRSLLTRERSLRRSRDVNFNRNFLTSGRRLSPRKSRRCGTKRKLRRMSFSCFVLALLVG